MASRYFLQLDRFEGPLDLLVHLIKVNEIDVFDIDIYFLTTQYLSFLRLIKFDDLADAGEFLEMAAHLIEIKSRMLLPNEKKKGEDEDSEDPRVPLQERLQLYEKFKKAAQHLGSRPMLGVNVYTNSEHSRLAPMFDYIESPLRGEPATLVVLYEQMLNNLTLRRKPGRVTLKSHTVTIERVIEALEQRMENLQFFSFRQMYGEFRNRYEFIANIMAMLELAKSGKLSIYQQDLLSPIWVYKKKSKVQLVPLKADFGSYQATISKYFKDNNIEIDEDDMMDDIKVVPEIKVRTTKK